MRIDMTLVLQVEKDYIDKSDRVHANNLSKPWGMYIHLSNEQAKRLRDEITKHLRGANRDKEPKEN